ncbi:MFS transporter [Achromobacter piechaudii]|nr:MFS transporter [Achromobacter piechaudii]
MTGSPPAVPSTRQQSLVIACAASATYLAASMGGSISLVLPQMAAALHSTASEIQWIIVGYILVRIAALRPAGTLCDQMGAKRIFIIGMGCFSLASALCALVDSESVLIPLRMLQGGFAAVLSPSALVLLRQAIPEQRQVFAMGVWSAAGMAGFGLSPLFGGALVHAWGWQAVFFFTAVLTLLMGIVAAALIPKSETARPRPTQNRSVLHELPASAALAGLAYVIGQPNTVGALGVGALIVALASFIMIKHRRALGVGEWRPWLRIVPFVGIGVFGFAAIAGVMLWASYFIQRDLHLSAFAFGLACVPMAVGGMLAIFGTDALVTAKRGNVAFLLGGAATVALSVSAYWAEAASLVAVAGLTLMFAGLCYGFINASVTSGVMSAFASGQSGDASAIATLSKQFGQLLGIAVVATCRDFSGNSAGDDFRLFYFFGICGVVITLCVGANAVVDTRRKQMSPQRAGQRST